LLCAFPHLANRVATSNPVDTRSNLEKHSDLGRNYQIVAAERAIGYGANVAARELSLKNEHRFALGAGK